MGQISKTELEDIVLHGIAADIFIAERAYTMLKTIGELSGRVNKTDYSSFFGCTQTAFKDQFMMATSRLYDKPSPKYQTRCIEGLLRYLESNSDRLPTIVEKNQLVDSMIEAGMQPTHTNSVFKIGDKEVTHMIVSFFRRVVDQAHIEKLRNFRNKSLAHNELVEKIDSITYKELLDLIDKAKQLVGIVGWAYMSMAFTVNGRYHLTEDAHGPKYSLALLIDRIGKDQK